MSRFVKEFNRLIKSVDKKFSGQAAIKDYDSDNMNCFIVELSPNSGPYKHGKFLFQIHASEHYPDSAPDVVCLTDIYHPNIDADLSLEHNICLNLFDEWNRTFGIEDCLQGLLFLLHHPNIADPVSSYFESSLDYATFLINVSRSLCGEEVDGFAFQKNQGWAEFEAASSAEPGPTATAATAVVPVSSGFNCEMDGEVAAPIKENQASVPISKTKSEENAPADISEAQSPEENPQADVSEAQSPEGNPEANVSGAQSPEENPQADVSETQSPEENPQADVSEAQSPEGNPEANVSGAQSPEENPQADVSGAQSPEENPQANISEVQSPQVEALAVDSGRPDTPDSLSLASDWCSLQALLVELNEEIGDGDFVCRRFRPAPMDTSDEDDEDGDTSECSDDDDDEEEFLEDSSSYDFDEENDGGLDLGRRRRRLRSLTATTEVRALPFAVRLHCGDRGLAQLLQVLPSSRYPGALCVYLNGRLLQPDRLRLLCRQAAQAFAESGHIWLGGGATALTAGGGADAASFLVCVLVRHLLLPRLL